MGKKLEIFLVEKITEMGLDWWNIKKKEFDSLPYLLKDKKNVFFEGIRIEVDVNGIDQESNISVSFDFLNYVYDSERYISKLDSAMQLSHNTGAIDEEVIREKPGLVAIKRIILVAIDNAASLMPPSYDFKQFIDQTLFLILSELDENSTIIEDLEYTHLVERFYKELQEEVFLKYKYKYDASESYLSSKHEKYPLRLNIEQIGAIALYLTEASQLSKGEKLSLFNHLAQVFSIKGKKVKDISSSQISSAFRKIKLPKHEGAGLKDIYAQYGEIIDSIKKGKTSYYLDID